MNKNNIIFTNPLKKLDMINLLLFIYPSDFSMSPVRREMVVVLPAPLCPSRLELIKGVN